MEQPRALPADIRVFAASIADVIGHAIDRAARRATTSERARCIQAAERFGGNPQDSLVNSTAQAIIALIQEPIDF